MTAVHGEQAAERQQVYCLACREPGLVVIDDHMWCNGHAVQLLLRRMQRQPFLRDRRSNN